MNGIVFSHAADLGLAEIWNATLSRWGEAQADAYLTALDARIATLSENPERGAVYADRADLRRLILDRHTVYYSFANNTVTIIRILHADMDPGAQLDAN